MNINPKELQKFHDLWAPMIAALPAVINAAETAAELTNHVAILQAQRDEAVSKRVAAEAEMAAAIQVARAELKAISADKAEATKAVKEHAKHCAEKIAIAEAATAEKLDALGSAVMGTEQSLNNVTTALATRKNDADADFARHIAAKQAEVADVEAKLVAAQVALDKLRAKFG